MKPAPPVMRIDMRTKLVVIKLRFLHGIRNAPYNVRNIDDRSGNIGDHTNKVVCPYFTYYSGQTVEMKM